MNHWLAIFDLVSLLIAIYLSVRVIREDLRAIKKEVADIRPKLDAIVPVKVEPFDDDFKIDEVKKKDKTIIFNPNTDPMGEFTGKHDDFYGDKNE